MPLRCFAPLVCLSAWVLCAPSATLSAQCPLDPLPVAFESLDAAGNPDSSFVGVGRDVAIAPGRVAVSALGETLFPGQSPTPFKGAAWILEPNAQGTWSEVAKLRGPFVGSSSFGFEIEFAGPDTLLVANPGNCPLDCVETGPTGEVFVFERSAAGWARAQVLASPTPFDNDSFGVALAADGDLLAVGAPADGTFTPGEVGSVHVFERTPSGWEHRARVLPSGPQWRFGAKIDLAGDLLVVADPAIPVSTGFPGAVHLFRMGAGPETWNHEATLERAPHDTNFSRFGACVSTDGTRIAVGVPGADLSVDPFAVFGTEPGARRSGRVDVFVDLGGGFVRTAALAPHEPEIGAGFGTSVALDDGRLVAGMPSATNSGVGVVTGTAHVFELRSGLWAPLDVLEATTLDGVNPTGAFAGIGTTVELLDGRVVLGVLGASFPNAPGQGAAAVFELDGAPCADRDLLGAPGLLSLALGGKHVWNVRAGAASAGQPYLVLGSISGTAPGVVVDGVHVPLNPDVYLMATLKLVNKPPFVATLGILDAAGRGTAAFALPPGFDPGLVGLELHHAALLFDASLVIVGATEPARLALVP